MHCTPEVYTSIGKDKHSLSIGLSIGSVKFKHERNAIMQHQPVFKLRPVWLPVKRPQVHEATSDLDLSGHVQA